MLYSRLYNLIALIILPLASYNQDVRFYAHTDAIEIVAGSYFDVIFTLENSEGSDFSPPDFGNLQILSGPNRSSQMSIINGAVSRKMSIGYSILAKDEGVIHINPASIRANGRLYESNGLEIKVLSSKAKRTDDENQTEMFVRMELSDTSAYIGQQITLKYILFILRLYN